MHGTWGMGRLRSLLVGAAILFGGCAIAGPGGRWRAGGAYVVGDRGAAEGAVSLRGGISPLAYALPERDWDFEVGYLLEAFPGYGRYDVRGGYVGGSYVPILGREVGGPLTARALVGLDADVMGGEPGLVVGATLSVGLEILAWHEVPPSSFSSVRSGYAAALVGEWAIGLTAFGSYRYALEQGHYGTFGAALAFRFPAGAVAGYVTPFGFDREARGQSEQEWEETNRRRGERRLQRRERRGHRPTVRFVCEGAVGRSEADDLQEARALCPGCACRDMNTVRAPAPGAPEADPATGTRD